MTDKEKPSEGFMERAAEIVIEWVDITPVAQVLQEEYRRGVGHGYEQGWEACRKEILSSVEIVRQSIDGLPTVAHAQKQIAHSIEEVQKPSEPEPDPPKLEVTPLEGVITPETKITSDPRAKNNPNGRPAPNRPASIPSNFEMAKEAIEKLGGRAAAPQIKKYVQDKWWPEAPKYWTSSLHDMADVGKLARDGINFILPKKPQQAVAPPAPKPFVQIKPQMLTPPPIAKLGPPSRTPGIEFKFGDKIVVLHEREHKIARRLRAAMGAGHLDSKFLAEAAGYHAGDKESWLKDMVSIMAPKLATVGLEVEFFKGFGFIMKELAA